MLLLQTGFSGLSRFLSSVLVARRFHLLDVEDFLVQTTSLLLSLGGPLVLADNLNINLIYFILTHSLIKQEVRLTIHSAELRHLLVVLIIELIPLVVAQAVRNVVATRCISSHMHHQTYQLILRALAINVGCGILIVLKIDNLGVLKFTCDLP